MIKTFLMALKLGLTGYFFLVGLLVMFFLFVKLLLKLFMRDK
ncbi:hypothetical protein ACSFC1_05185 [Pseudothermotoga sp. U03pept]